MGVGVGVGMGVGMGMYKWKEKGLPYMHAHAPGFDDFHLPINYERTIDNLWLFILSLLITRYMYSAFTCYTKSPSPLPAVFRIGMALVCKGRR